MKLACIQGMKLYIYFLCWLADRLTWIVRKLDREIDRRVKH